MIGIRHIRDYNTLVFDCDGVILDSNKVKTQAFFSTALPYGEEFARRLKDYHVNNGGVSRYHKFTYFLDNIVGAAPIGPAMEQLLTTFASDVRNGLLKCEAADGLPQLRQQTSHSHWMVVSGGDQAELRFVFAQRGLTDLFDRGIYGSPDTKELILEREIRTGSISQPALFLGDSCYDYSASNHAGLDFLFMSLWSEVEDWQGFVADNGIATIPSVSHLLDL